MTKKTLYSTYTLHGIYRLFQRHMSEEINKTYGTFDDCDYISLMAPEDFTQSTRQADLEDFMLKGCQEHIQLFLNYYRELLDDGVRSIKNYIAH